MSKDNTCEWTILEEYTTLPNDYVSGCGQDIELWNDHDFKYCPYCGKKIVTNTN